MERKIFITCEYCAGEGQIVAEVPEIPAQGEKPAVPAHDVFFECPECNGEGVVLQLFYKGASDISNILDKVDDILDKCNDIFEKVSE